MRAAVAVALVVAASGCVGDASRTEVVDVADGDTIDVGKKGEVETLRLIGIDAPETFSPVNPGEFGVNDSNATRQCLSRWAERASYQAQQMDGEAVRLVSDGERGSYGRLLAYVFSHNSSKSFNYRMVRQGYARVYESRFRKRASFLEAQEKARKQDLGVWSCQS